MAAKKNTVTIPLPSRNLLLGVGVAIALLVGVFALVKPPAPIVVPVTYTLTDEYGGVFSSSSTCAPRSADYAWVSGEISVSPQAASGLTPSLTVTASVPTVTRSSASDCTWTFFVSISPLEVGPLNLLVGQGQFPSSLGAFDISLGSEPIGSIAPALENNLAVNLKRTISVTNTIYGVARLGDLNASRTGDAGNFPKEWECRGRVAWDGYYWIGYYNYDKYRSISKLDITNTKNVSKCWGVNSYKDFKVGAKVTVTAGGRIYTTTLAKTWQVALPRTIPMQGYEWYLTSKSDKTVVCHFAWTIADLPFSETGYSVKIGERDPKTFSLAELEQGDWLVFTDHGNDIPSFTRN